jgi:CheY-like chemotaxis protein
MSRVLLADDSAHAQRMGVRILREEGIDVVSVTDGDAALTRLADSDPDLVLVDVFLPGKSGLEVCRYIKEQPRHKHARVVLTAGILDTFDEAEAKEAGCDGIIRKPFEASAVVRALKPLIRDAKAARTEAAAPAVTAEPGPPPPPAERLPVELPPVVIVEPPPEPELEPAAAAPQPVPSPAPLREEAAVDPTRVRAAVTVALDAAFPALIDELTERVLAALRR